MYSGNRSVWTICIQVTGLWGPYVFEKQVCGDHMYSRNRSVWTTCIQVTGPCGLGVFRQKLWGHQEQAVIRDKIRIGRKKCTGSNWFFFFFNAHRITWIESKITGEETTIDDICNYVEEMANQEIHSENISEKEEDPAINRLDKWNKRAPEIGV